MSTLTLVSAPNPPLWPSQLPNALEPSIISYCDKQMFYSMQRVCRSWNRHPYIQAQMDSCAIFDPRMIEFFRDCNISINRLPEKPPEDMLWKLLSDHAFELKKKTAGLCKKTFSDQELKDKAIALHGEVDRIWGDIHYSGNLTKLPQHAIFRKQDLTLYRYVLTKRKYDPSFCSLINLPNLVSTGGLDLNRAEIQILIQKKSNGVVYLFTISARDFDLTSEWRRFGGANVFCQNITQDWLTEDYLMQIILTNPYMGHQMVTKNPCASPPITNKMVIELHERIKKAAKEYEEIANEPALPVYDANLDSYEEDEDKNKPLPLKDKMVLKYNAGPLESIADLEAMYPTPLPEIFSLKTHATALLVTTIAFLANWVGQTR